MTMPAAGVISTQDLALELGRTQTAKTNVREGRFLLGNGTGNIGLSDMYGKAVSHVGYEDWSTTSEIVVVCSSISDITFTSVFLLDVLGAVVMEYPLDYVDNNTAAFFSLPPTIGKELLVAHLFEFQFQDPLSLQPSLHVSVSGQESASASNPLKIFCTSFQAITVPPIYRE